jgi:hypothetical protein
VAQLSTQQVTLTAAAVTYTAASGGGDTFLADEKTFAHIKNGSGGAITVTFATPGTVSGLAIADLAVSVPAGGDRVVGPFPPGLFGSAAGLVDVTYSGVTSLTVGILRAG